MTHKKYLAPAKINLCLHVNRKRLDGYHDLTMIMQSVSLYDELDFTVVTEPGVSFHCATELGPCDNNLVVRAARAILAYGDPSSGVDIVLNKNIPVAAGLGGGSSDAATTLIALNELLGLNLNKEVLHKEAVALGADVPFFLYQSVAWASGIGDQFSPVKIEPLFWLVLVNPGVGVSTADVYGDLGDADYSSCSMVAKIVSHNDLVSLLYNGLERPAIKKCGAIGEIKGAFVELQADGVLMSGSGATVFGLFFDQRLAQHAATAFSEKHGYWSRLVSPLS